MRTYSPDQTFHAVTLATNESAYLPKSGNQLHAEEEKERLLCGPFTSNSETQKPVETIHMTNDGVWIQLNVTICYQLVIQTARLFSVIDEFW